MFVLYFLQHVSKRLREPIYVENVPSKVEASCPQRQLGGLLGRAVAPQDGAQAGLELDIVIPTVAIESLIDVI